MKPHSIRSLSRDVWTFR
uniref:Uncharacterized protein n=1 Tax=Anguilla anguilla TaxID=7936 RepID=A0A0E9S3N8_ANGAN